MNKMKQNGIIYVNNMNLDDLANKNYEDKSLSANLNEDTISKRTDKRGQ